MAVPHTHSRCNLCFNQTEINSAKASWELGHTPSAYSFPFIQNQVRALEFEAELHQLWTLDLILFILSLASFIQC